MKTEEVMKVKDDLSNRQGECPHCMEVGCLDYDAVQFVDDQCYFPWTCKECGLQGEEWYRLEFNGHNIITEEGDCIEV